MTKHKNEDKPIDWMVLIGAIAFFSFGVGAPYILYVFGGLDIQTWGFDSWELYVAIICFVVYFAIGKVIHDMRNDDET